ncbi:MAG: response regulator [Gammaproteobacteria bacterium]|nr:response regulator [Gammaproteobacteria bacterium]
MSDKRTRIIVVDGSAVSRAILTRILHDEVANAEVFMCANGAEALVMLDTGRYDLVSTALMLPDMDGLELSRHIRQSRTHSYIPIIVVSGDADSRLLREGFEAGVTDYFDKSQGYKAFGSFIRSFIQRNSGMMGHILFVEDSATAAAAIQKILERQGLRVTHVRSAEDALQLMENTQQANHLLTEEYDMVITDFYLVGELTGGDLLYALRAKMHFSQQEMPVLVLTSTEDQQTQVEAFHAGANDFVTKPIVEEVLIARVRSLLLIKHQYNALKHQAEAMRWIAVTDSLTGVRSKRYLVDNGEAYIADPAHQPVWAMLIDIDHFKQINDSLGHITGDHVLAELGDTLNRTFKDGVVVRFGGEEFCVLIPKADQEQILERAELLRQQIQQLRPAGVDISVSIGLATTADFPGESLTRFLSYADKALYRSKEAGRNRVHFYQSQQGPLPSPYDPHALELTLDTESTLPLVR